MATLHHGILGGFSGKVGNIVGYRYKNQYCIRQVPRKSIKLPSSKQLSQREKFKFSYALISPLRGLMKQLPAKGKKRISAYNFCLSKVLKEALTGTFPHYSINYAALQLSSGNLSAGHCHAVRLVQNNLVFSWCADIPDFCMERRLAMLAYHPLSKKWISDTFELRPGDCMGMLSLPCSFIGEQVETYMFFMTTNGKAVSNSIYLGTVSLPDQFFSESFFNLN